MVIVCPTGAANRFNVGRASQSDLSDMTVLNVDLESMNGSFFTLWDLFNDCGAEAKAFVNELDFSNKMEPVTADDAEAMEIANEYIGNA